MKKTPKARGEEKKTIRKKRVRQNQGDVGKK